MLRRFKLNNITKNLIFLGAAGIIIVGITGIASFEGSNLSVKDSSQGIQEESALQDGSSSNQLPVQSVQNKASKSDDDEWDDDDDSSSSVSVPTAPSSAPVTQTQTAGAYTMSQVAVHSTVSDCWSVVNGGVYNLTSWIAKHPGGAGAIKSMCGKDSSAEFNAQHKGEQKPESILISYKVGILK